MYKNIDNTMNDLKYLFYGNTIPSFSNNKILLSYEMALLKFFNNFSDMDMSNLYYIKNYPNLTSNIDNT